MNLMFWKKKSRAAEEAENARKNLAVNRKPQVSLDFIAAKQGAADHDPEPLDPETTSTAMTKKMGMAARIKLRLSALVRHFKKAPAFRAEEHHVPEARSDSKEPDDVAAMEPDFESPDPEAPAKPGLALQIKLWLISLAQRFKKAPTPAANEDWDADSHGRSEASSGDEYPEDASDAGPARSKKRLVIGGVIGLLVLLLFGIGIAIWPVFAPPQKQWGANHDVTPIAPRASQPESVPENTQTEIEALKRENAELQARIEALKNGPPVQRPYVPPAWQARGNSPSSSVGGEMTVDSKDPKATAMSLKEAIEAMNASSGDYNKKPAK
ncbi:MAG TPA: hypothetical protein VFQ99_04920 [Gallionella sp.]|nr:hypothetical protein [Gallionella sp.]